MGKTTIQQFFLDGMDRLIPDLIDPPEGLQINLGPGEKKSPRYYPDGPPLIGVGLPGNSKTDVSWRAGEPLPFDTGSVAAVHSAHFLEHIPAPVAVLVLKEVERILMPGGVMFNTTPHPIGGLYFENIEHCTPWTTGSWQNLIGNEYQQDSSWKLRINFNLIVGIVERNICLLTQLVRMPD